MTDKPILFSGPMVQALLAGRKTQTRRVFKGVEEMPDGRFHVFGCGGGAVGVTGEYVGAVAVDYAPFAAGDRLYVREGHALVPTSAYRSSEGVEQAVNPQDSDQAAIYRLDWSRSTGGLRWRPGLHMPRWASRLTLTVTEVRVQRVAEISREDELAEGVEPGEHFDLLWDSLNAERGFGFYDVNPWVVAISFTVERGNIDALSQHREGE